MPTVTVTVTDPAGHVTAPASASWSVQSAQLVAGMSSPADQFDLRLSQVGESGINARRIFCDLTSSGNDQQNLINDAVAAGMIPFVSYKVPSFVTAAQGGYDTWITAAATMLNSLGTTVYATIWHEPYPDMTAAQFLAMHRRMMPLLKKPNVKVGPVLSTWLLDNASNRPTFESYIADDLFADGTYTWFGFDSYQSGDQTTPGNKDLSTRMPILLPILAAHGAGNVDLACGEFNAYTNASLQAICNTILNTPQIKLACVFDSDVGAKGIVLTGSMLTTFQAFKADSRVLQ